MSRGGRASPPIIDRRTKFGTLAPGRIPLRARARSARSYRGKVSAIVLVTVMFGSFMGVLMSYSGHVSSYTSHDPIVIDDNSDFAIGTYGVLSGNGSAGNPWIISGWNITADGEYGISVSDTTAHFVITDVLIESVDDWTPASVHFDNVANGSVVSSIFRNTTAGVEAISSDNLTVSQCQFVDANTGVHLTSVDNVSVSGCSFSDGVQSQGWDGVYTTLSWFCEIDNNTMSQMTNGVQSLNSHTMAYTSNNISNSENYGLYLQSVENGIVFNNSLCYNGHSGVFLDGCTDVLVYWNSFFSNGPSQAYDDTGTGTAWDAGAVIGGNYWSDYTGDGSTPYAVAGTPGNQDNYPLTEPPESQIDIPEFSTVIVPVLFVMVMFLAIYRRRSV